LRYRIGKDKGFTIIEVICVLAILGIISGMAVPRFQRIQAGWELKAAAR